MLLIMRRFCFLSAVAAFLATFAFPAVLMAYTIDDLRADREVAKWRDRGLIYNNDGGDMMYGEEHTPQGLLDARTSGVAGSQLDSLFYCIHTPGMVYHNSQVSERFTTTEGRYYNNMTQELFDQGTDALEVMSNFSRQNDIEIFASMRMNDTHDASGDRLLYAFPEIKTLHPNWIMGDSPAPAYGKWSAFDFNVPEIRDFTLDIFEELCTNYDVDGIELDFFRSNIYFRNHAFNGTATQAECDLMTQLVRDIRTMTEQVGLQKGKPILVAVRVPDSMGYAAGMGLDVPQWLDEGLVDLMTVSGLFRAEEWSTSVALGHSHDVPVYACLSDSRVKDEEAKALRKSLECYYARASGALEEGVDGIYMFNYFHDDTDLWHVAGDEATLQGKDKVYVTGARNTDYMDVNLLNGEDYHNRVLITPDNKLSLQRYVAQSVPMAIGDDLSGIDDSDVRVRLRLSLDSMPSQTIYAYLNIDGAPTYLGAATITGNYLDYNVDPSLIAKGSNEFVLYSNATTGSAVLNDFLVYINYRPTGNAVSPLLREPFPTVVAGDPSQGKYAPGPIIAAGASPTSDYFTTNWTTGHGTQTHRFEAVTGGLTYSGMDTNEGAVRFTSDATVSGLQSMVREFDATSYTTEDREFYLTGMISFDENFSTDPDSYSMIGLLNAEEGDPSVDWTIGLQWGFAGNGNGGVDAVLRYREHSTGYPVVTSVISEDVDPGTHLFVMKVLVDQDGSTDYVSVWLDPENVWADVEGGTETLYINDALCWLLPSATPNPNRLVDTLVLNVNEIGNNTSVVFDEVRLGMRWGDLFLPIEEELIPGDANGDGCVDGSDATVLANYWQYGVGMTTPDATWAMGDFNGDHVVDGSDATILASHWQEGTNPTAAVPEPSTLVLLMLGTVFCLMRFGFKR